MQGEKGPDYSQLHLAMIGHELRNVLSGVVGLSDLLGESGLKADQVPMVRALRHSAGQMRWLIERIGLEGQSPRFPFSPRIGQVNGIEFLEHLIRRHTPAARERGNWLLLEVEPSLPTWWRCDERLLGLLLDNLLGNAIKFNQDGRVGLAVRGAPAITPETCRLEIKVWDSGPGIAPGCESRMFKPWRRLHRHGSDIIGSGLGLHVCKRIVKELRGMISYSADGTEGSCFTVRLPNAFEINNKVDCTYDTHLLRSMSCLLKLRADLRPCLISMLTRLNVGRVLSAGAETEQIQETGCYVEISDGNPCRSVGDSGRGLWLKLSERGRSRPDLSAFRFLPQPVVESTLRPLLLELALEYRLSRVPEGRLRKLGDGMPDSVPRPR